MFNVRVMVRVAIGVNVRIKLRVTGSVRAVGDGVGLTLRFGIMLG